MKNAMDQKHFNVLIISIQFKDSFIILILLQEVYLYFFLEIRGVLFDMKNAMDQKHFWCTTRL